MGIAEYPVLFSGMTIVNDVLRFFQIGAAIGNDIQQVCELANQ